MHVPSQVNLNNNLLFSFNTPETEMVVVVFHIT